VFPAALDVRKKRMRKGRLVLLGIGGCLAGVKLKTAAFFVPRRTKNLQKYKFLYKFIRI